MECELELLERQCGERSARPPLLFVHGSGHAAWCWDEHFLDFFAERGFSSYAVSLRGHGNSGGLERLRWVSVAQYVSDVARVAARLPRAPIVVGHSLGGLVVQKYLENHDAPAAVLLAPTPVVGMLRPGVRLFLQNPWLFMRAYLTLEPSTVFSTPELARKFLFSPDLSEEQVQRYAGRFGRESFRAYLEMMYNLPSPERIRGTPMLVLGGSLDYLIPPSEIRSTADACHAESKIVPGLGHDLMLDAGWERAADVVQEWLVRTLAPSSAGSQ